MRAVLSWLALPLMAANLTPLDEPGYARLIQSHKGQVVLVDFWATWCDPCREELPQLRALSQRLHNPNFKLITISADEPENEPAAAALLDKLGLTGPRYVKHAGNDQTFIDSVDRKWSGALPALFLYDAAGNRIASFIGEPDLAALESTIRKALASATIEAFEQPKVRP